MLVSCRTAPQSSRTDHDANHSDSEHTTDTTDLSDHCTEISDHLSDLFPNVNRAEPLPGGPLNSTAVDPLAADEDRQALGDDIPPITLTDHDGSGREPSGDMMNQVGPFQFARTVDAMWPHISKSQETMACYLHGPPLPRVVPTEPVDDQTKEGERLPQSHNRSVIPKRRQRQRRSSQKCLPGPRIHLQSTNRGRCGGQGPTQWPRFIPMEGRFGKGVSTAPK